MPTRSSRTRALAGLAALLAACAPPASRWDAAGPEAAEEPPADHVDGSPDSALFVAGATFDLVLDGEPPVSAAELKAWIRRNAERVAAYCGSFPVPDLHLTIVSSGGGRVGYGFHQDGRRIRVRLGRRTSPRSLEHDWVLVHEMMHAAFPDLDRDHRWMQEGLSTYVEPLLRARDGELTEEAVWSKWVRMMPNGRPGFADRGLDRTHTWGRTYWGGALFWLVVDLKLRERTGGEKSLRDAVRGILAAGGNGRVDWTTARVVRVADEATGTTVMHDVYAAMAQAPGDVDLDELWASLGVVPGPGGVSFDDDAPLAGLRRAMTRD